MGKSNQIKNRRSALSAAKRALLEKRLQGTIKSGRTAKVISRRSEKEFRPLSFAQERLWILSQLEPDSPAYNRPVVLRLGGALNLTALRQGLSEILRRHEVLRATFSTVDGRPVQVITSAQPVSLSVVDLSKFSANERQHRAKRLAVDEVQHPFNLTRGPLLRAILLRLDKEDHLLIVVIHHIAFDGWSAQILVNELAALYEAFAFGTSPSLVELPIQYADFAYWQREQLQGEMLESRLAYWKETLKDAPPSLDLPTDHFRPATLSYRGAKQTLKLPAVLVNSLKTLSRQHGVTLFMTLLAAFKILLCRYTGQHDIVVGTFTAGRSHVETEGLIGFFINTLVMRTDLTGNPTFRELTGRIREVFLKTLAHQDLPFEKLIEQLRPERDLSRPPVFQVMFNLENIPRKVIKTPALSIEEVEFDNGIALFDLGLEIIGNQSTLICLFNYNIDLFKSETIKRMMGHFQSLLEGIIADPNQPLSELPLLTDAEQHQLLVEWNDTRKEYPQYKCIHQLFEAQVEQKPDAVAVVFGDHQLTYQELNCRANQLAHYLRALGVGPEVLVGICVERSIEMVVGLLGILKAGGAYVPLDPGYPKRRLAFVVEDTQIHVLLTQKHLAKKLPINLSHVICLDDARQKIAANSADNPIGRTAGDNLAYVIYTSGSTGKPKGVMIEHRSLVNLTEAAVSAYDVASEDRILQFASISFDTSAEEIYSCLTCGATLVLRTDLMLSSAGVFLEKCREWALTVLDLPTAYWHELTSKLGPEDLSLPPSLRLVIIGGEKALPDKLALWQQYAGSGLRLMNSYGPTEATVTATLLELSRSATKDPMRHEIPIGHAIQNVNTYLLDRYFRPVPIGVPGELHIGGTGLARGYLNRPELTAQKFIDNPFSQDPTARLYKTGDLARYLPDGNIEFLGRIDHQVKIRGFRIELGEIEMVLGQHPAVRETVVIAREDVPGDKRLVAYVVAAQKQGFVSGELRDFLQQKLPGYMVPSAFVRLDQLPLDPNGKVDRRSLPAPERTRPELEKSFVAPRTPAEEVLAGIWCTVLGIERVGVNDNFFELGGHSLLAIRVAARIGDACGVELPVRNIFESPTLADLALVITQRKAEKAERKDINAILSQLEMLSDEEAQHLISTKTTRREN